MFACVCLFVIYSCKYADLTYTLLQTVKFILLCNSSSYFAAEKMVNKEDLRKQATLLNGKKSSVLESMRTGKIGLPLCLENHIKDACTDEKNLFYIYIKKVFEARTAVCRLGLIFN